MRNFVVIFLILLIVAACDKYGHPGEMEPYNVIASVWVNPVNGKVLDLSQLPLNREVSASLIIACDGTYGNSGKINGISLGNVELSGTISSGLLVFGHLKYVGASDISCHDYSREVYQYDLQSDGMMVLCMKNYPYCTTYVKQ